jgi:hypothetical protein
MYPLHVKHLGLGFAFLALIVLAAGCGGGGKAVAVTATPVKATPKPACPASWLSGWQRLADRIAAPVYCPAWVPSPLTAQIGGKWSTGVEVSKNHSYLAGFIWFEHGSEVHINLRGYPGRASIPRCVNEEQVGKKLVKTKVPCFADPKGTHRIGTTPVTLYTVNRDADQWHLLYAWRRHGSLYALSEHVAPPFGYQRVLQNLNRMFRQLVLVEPKR